MTAREFMDSLPVELGDQEIIFSIDDLPKPDTVVPFKITSVLPSRAQSSLLLVHLIHIHD